MLLCLCRQHGSGFGDEFIPGYTRYKFESKRNELGFGFGLQLGLVL